MLRGLKTVLREAIEADRRKAYEWLAHSDLTPSIMGPPRFSDHPVPSWEEFCADYRPYYFDGSKPNQGRCFVIVASQTEVGVVCYNALRSDNVTDVDI
jgi:diamine N-acetyltransferase